MRRNLILPPSLLVATLALTTIRPAPAVADTEDFTLTKAIPADALMAVHARGHAGQAFLKEQYARVWKAVAKARFDRDIRRLLKNVTQQSGGDLEEFETNWKQMMELVEGVEWSTLGERELAYAEKLGLPSFYEGVLLMKPPADKVAADFEGLAAFLKTLAGFAPDDLILTEDIQGATVIHKLTFKGAALPLGLTLARHKDVLLVGLGSSMVEQSLALLRGEPGETLAATPRFQEAFKRLPPAQDSLTFVDAAKLMDQLRSMLAGIKQMIPPPPPAPQSAVAEGQAPAGQAENPGTQAIELVGKIIDALDMWDYYASVASTDGMRTTSDTITVLRADAESRPLYKAIYGTGTLSDPLKYVPQAANDVTVTTGVDWLALYEEILKFIADEVPGGQDQLATWSALQEEWGLSVGQDILGWIQGGICTFSVPGATPYSPGETVLMLRVRDEEKAREMIGRALDAIEPVLAQQGGAISDAEIAGTQGFRSIVYPMLAMLGMKSPTVGVTDGWLFAGSSPEIISTALEVSTGVAESFARNELFLQDGIPPGKNVTALSFTDLTKMGEQLGQVLKIVPFAIRMAGGQQLAQNPGANMLLSVLTKLGSVAPELNFFQSSCSQSTFDGRTVVTRNIITYREPPKPPAPAAPAEQEESAPAAPGEPEG